MMSYKEIEEEWIKTVNEKKHIISLIDNKEILSVDRFIERTIFMNINGIISINNTFVNNINDSCVIINYTNTNDIIDSTTNHTKYHIFSVSVINATFLSL